MTTLAGCLAIAAHEEPGRAALRLGRRIWTFAELTERVRATAGLLASYGVGTGTRVGLLLPNVPAFPIVFLAGSWAGATVVPMNPLLAEHDLDHQATDASVTMLVVLVGFEGAARAVGERRGIDVLVVATPGPDDRQLRSTTPAATMPASRADDDAVLLYSPRPGGAPRGARLSHDNLLTNAAACADTLLEIGPDDVVMGCLPLFHAYGLTCALNASLVSRACLALVPRFDARQALALIDKLAVTVFEGVPSMFSGMLAVPVGERADTSRLRLCVSGGSTLPADVLNAFEASFSTSVLEGYGRPETSPLVCFNHPRARRRPGAIGTPVRGVEVRLVDVDGHDVVDPSDEVGEIAVRGEGLMAGYWNDPEATASAIPDGWFRTGDLTRRDEDGYYYVVDRKKSLIVRGGYNVHPREIEEALYEHDAVAEVAVVGLAHPTLGEEVGAAVALKAGARATAEDLRDHTRARVAAYKLPRYIWFVDELPKGPTGTILRRAVVVPDGIAPQQPIAESR